jgi:hypothetical protein
MSSQILITMDDLETAVRLNAAFEAAGFSTAMFSSLDDARGSVRRENPDLEIFTGAIHTISDAGSRGEAPGIAEALRNAAYHRFPRAALSRGLAGVRGKTLIVNLPGSPGGVKDGLAVLDGLVEHAVGLVKGESAEH